MREIMLRAHEIARTLVGHYHARMALALRMAWAEARKPKELRREVLVRYENGIRKNIRLRLNRWTKYGKDRIYVEEVRDRWYLKIGFLDLLTGRWNPDKLTNPELNTLIREAVFGAAAEAGLIA